MIQPFTIREGMSSMKYSAVFVSDSLLKAREDLDRYFVEVEIDPWDKLVSFSCECKGFMFKKTKMCKHLLGKSKDNPGLLDILKQWGEVQGIPTFEDNNGLD